MKSYLDTTADVYRDAALTPDVGLCCTTTPVWKLPGLNMPSIMLEMNYGCGSTVNSRDLVNEPNILYVGVGGGMEVFQFSYFSRKQGSIIGVDVVDEMLAACRNNLILAEATNDWFHSDFVDLRKGSKTFGQYKSVILDSTFKHMVWIPPGFAHGFLSMSDQTVMLYSCTGEYSPENEKCIKWDDESIGIKWPQTSGLIISEKDICGDQLKHIELFSN